MPLLLFILQIALISMVCRRCWRQAAKPSLQAKETGYLAGQGLGFGLDDLEVVGGTRVVPDLARGGLGCLD